MNNDSILQGPGDGKTPESAAEPKFKSIENVARVKLALLNAAMSLRDLSLPGFRLEKLVGDRAGQYSIRINDQSRLCFNWHHGDAYDVEITDYH